MATLVLALAAPAATVAQISPCNMGRDLQHEPRNPAAICMPLVGRMDASPSMILYLFPVGDVDNSGTADFLAYNLGGQLLLYKGVPGRFPTPSEGERIGPSELNSITEFLASGDFDGDHHVDIVVKIRIQGDTSAGNRGGYDVCRLVVFWGNDSGRYSIQDTTRLDCGAQMWLAITNGVGADVNGDGVDDLLVCDLLGFSNNTVIDLPKMMMYQGHHGERWGRNGVPSSADWRFWGQTARDYTAISALDQDQDGVTDIIFARNDAAVVDGRLSVLYGRSGLLPDTNNFQTVSFAPSAGRYALFSDVTGDKVPDLLIGSGRDDFVKVFVGFKGQRLLEQYGSGHDTAQPGSGKWWGRPWDTVWLPRRINPEWFGDNDRLFDLGDANLDGVGDIFAFSWPYMVEYNGGRRLDSLADALIDITPGTTLITLKSLGNIDGSGRNIIALTAENDNEIRFYAPTRDISSFGEDRDLPPGTGVAAVERPFVPAAPTLRLAAVPNPSHGEVDLQWDAAGTGQATLLLADASGREVRRVQLPAFDTHATFTTAGLPAGVYVVRLTIGSRSALAKIVVQ
ncbi:MAG TPA: T9SS type A sorting domain-containing protein [Candidatus Kapabacteria bacterium]|nr:T9SS type A sorting domain-containing protein [Candidatus Kapabacteria bacterium]